MCKEKSEKLKNLEDATTNLKKEIFGLTCKIEGVIASKETNEYSKSWCENLDKMKAALNQIKIEVSKDTFEFCIPEYFLNSEAGVLGVLDFNVTGTWKLLKSFKNKIISDEALTLPGKETSYSENGLATDLLRAISEFEDAFLDYIE